MATGTLYTYPDNFRAFKALIAAQYSGAKVKVVSDPPAFKFGETNKSDAFLQKFPLGKVPAFESDNGVKLFESNAIAYFVANEALRGSNPTDAAYVQQWVNFADNEILPASCTWVFPCLGIMQFNKQNTERAKEDVNKALSVLNSHLETRTFLVGERVSLADVAVTCNLLQLYKIVLDPAFRKPYQNTNRWFVTMVNQPQVKAVLGEVTLCEKMAQFDAKKFQEMQGGGAKKEKAKKEPQPKKEKQEKPKKEAEQPADDEPKPEKPKDPFAHLPAGNWNMDEWKKVYSNNDTLEVALPYFWKNFDKENYSIWYGEYNYASDLTMTFMSANLISGMFQRLDKMRKHSFGSMCLFGTANNSTISGVWFWKGQGLAFDMSDDLQIDSPSYTWTKLDPDSDATKLLVKEYFNCEGDFGGKKLHTGKIFK